MARVPPEQLQKLVAEAREGIKTFVPGLGMLPLNEQPTHYLDLKRHASTDGGFWLSQHNWPIDGLGKTFLGRAVLRVGKALHGDAWTGYEPTVTRHLLPLPDHEFFAKDWEKHEACELLRLPVKYGPMSREYPENLGREWPKALAARQASLALVGEIQARWSSAMRTLADACLNGTVAAFTRQPSNDFKPMRVQDWLLDPGALWERFRQCETSKLWVYVDENNLATLCSGFVRVEQAKASNGPDEVLVTKAIEILDADRAAGGKRSAKDVLTEIVSELENIAIKPSSVVTRLLGKLKKRRPNLVQQRHRD